MRLIDAHDLWTEIMMIPHNGDMISSEEVEKAIAEAPTVDAVPVVHGRWGNYDPYLDGYRCSRCKLSHRCCTPYCSNCGAKMDGGENNV